MAEHGTVIDAAILAGGLGTRLRQTIGDRPKVLAPVAGRPFLSHLLDHVAAAGMRRAVLCTGYLADQVQATFGDRYGALALSYSRELSPQGTAGAVRLAAPLLHSDPVLVLNGDSFCAEPLEDFVIWHQRRGEPRAASLLVTWVEDAARYGTVDLDDADGIVAFREKNGRNAPGWINTGAYLLSQHLLSSIPAQGVTSFEHDVFPDWAGRGLAGYRVRAPFVDIGTPDSYTQAETWLAQHLRTGCPQGSAS